MSGRYDQIKNMSLDELKDEYYNCKNEDQVKKQMLKKLIKNKNKEVAPKITNQVNQTNHQIKSIKQTNPKANILTNKITNEITDKITDKITDELTNKITKSIDKLISLKESKKVEDLAPVINKRGNMEQYWESHQQAKKIDPRFIKEISTDHSNNKLMERLNCELDFRIYGDPSKDNSDIIKPYSNSDDGNFKDFEKYCIPATSFDQNPISINKKQKNKF